MESTTCCDVGDRAIQEWVQWRRYLARHIGAARASHGQLSGPVEGCCGVVIVVRVS